ncbi:protein of unknown function [Flavobacterium succinicans]|uniref:DUF3885 domain-containing protein n=1 Tax=Flavobacterium succinicans TaxID=29536 RepID=A0A1I5ACX5_9FLAO|nr:DUF3885 domain-containing protein [Flavobacterium succinicans]SFN60263.1 protein of unknown function [Flavobacterium succinicans]
MKEILQTYLDKTYPNSKVETPHSVFGNVHIRFELGGDEMFKIIRNGTEIEWWKDRRRMTKVDKLNYEKYILKSVSKATSRATTLFYETFDNLETEIWILIYEYSDGLFNKPSDFLLNQFPKNIRTTFYDVTEQVETQMLTEQEDGSFICDKTEARIIVGKVKVKDIQAEQILNGIANNEMGFEPTVCQNIYFLDPATDRGFYMYDDRGCYVWSNKAEKIKYLYDKRNSWIVNYHRPEIDKYFIQS